MLDAPIPPFRPHGLFRGGHVQTLAAAYLTGRTPEKDTRRHRVRLADDDVIVLHDDCPEDWQPPGRIAILMHGLAGCHQSRYMTRIAAKLSARGVRVFRMDHRGCGAGRGLARLPYHAGATNDLRSVIDFVTQLAPQASLSLVGFSLSGNIVLGLLGQEGQPLSGIRSAIAVCPPVDLHAACEAMDRRFPHRWYGRHFVQLLMRQVREKQRLRADAPRVYFREMPKRLRDFDDQYTAPLSGFADVDDYYTRASSQPLLANNSIPTLLLASRDDPMVPIHSIEDASLSESTKLVIADRGGHLGFLAKRNGEPDRHWMDWRVVDWIVCDRD
ncbi:MAG: alpha/beta fold hydrolase [Pirellulales bacterium]|nr:alpha/beta fold hydrolase [Pirellulales bacterium]